MITLLSPPTADWNAKRGEEYFCARKKEYDMQIAKATENKLKRAKINAIPTPSSAKGKSPISNNNSDVALVTAVDGMLAHMEQIVSEQHTFFDKLEQRQRENFQQVILNQQTYFCNLLNVLNH